MVRRSSSLENPEERRNRIIDAAISLAKDGGFENVRQRDVAAQAGLALGTLYKSFRSKEDILSAALERDTQTLADWLERNPVSAPSPEGRVVAIFRLMTRALCRKPHYARAVLRAMTAGDTTAAQNVASYHDIITKLVVDALHGKGALTDELPAHILNQSETIAKTLQQVWFSALVGWSMGLYTQAEVLNQTERASHLVLLGVNAEGHLS